MTVLDTYASSRISVWNTSTLPNRIVFRYYEGFPANVSQGASMAGFHDYSVVVQPEQGHVIESELPALFRYIVADRWWRVSWLFVDLV